MDQINRRDPMSEEERLELFRTATVMDQGELINQLVGSLLLKVRGSGEPVIICSQLGISDEHEPVIDMLLIELRQQIAHQEDIVVMMEANWIFLLARPSELGN